MKYIKSFIALAFMALFTVSCDQDLPYPLDDVKKGVVIDIVRGENTDGVLSAGITEGNYKIKLSIPKQQGDYSMMGHAQLVCVFTNAAGETTSKVVTDDIKTFPTEVNLDIAKIYQQFGLQEPALGEVLNFTTNAILKDGYVVYGWNEFSGFNNSMFTGWLVDGRGYSYSARYPVVCPLFLEDFVGDMVISDAFNEAEYGVSIVKISDTELEMHGFFGGEDPEGVIKIVIDPSVHTVTIPKQVITPSYGSYTNLSIEATGTLDACKGTITFTGPITVDQGGFGSFNFVIKH